LAIHLIWHGTLSEMGMVVISSTIMVGPITDALDPDGQPKGEGGAALARSFPRFAADNARTFAPLTFNPRQSAKIG
jgi:hypothetical protein